MKTFSADDTVPWNALWQRPIVNVQCKWLLKCHAAFKNVIYRLTQFETTVHRQILVMVSITVALIYFPSAFLIVVCLPFSCNITMMMIMMMKSESELRHGANSSKWKIVAWRNIQLICNGTQTIHHVSCLLVHDSWPSSGFENRDGFDAFDCSWIFIFQVVACWLRVHNDICWQRLQV
jgi:hypothetical protein